MKYLLLLLTAAIGAALLYKYLIAADMPATLQKQIALQVNPFTVVKDSAAAVRHRAILLLEGRKHLLAGGKRIQTDSMIYLPYYNNDYRKGNSILIESHSTADSVLFKVSWWYSGKLQDNGAKEVALFMQKGISWYNNRF